MKYTKTFWRGKMNFTEKYIDMVKGLNEGEDIVKYCIKKNKKNYYDNSNEIYKLHFNQTEQSFYQLSEKYKNNYIFENVSILFLVNKLKDCIDITDGKLFDTSQFVHSWQVFNGMLLNNETNEDLFVMAFIHDLGKLLKFKNEKPENIYCANKIIKFDSNLSNSILNWNHDEYCCTRLKPYLSEKMLFCIRHHSLNDMNNKNYIKNEKSENLDFLYNFYEYDQNTKGEYIPEIMNDSSKQEYIENLLLKYFPNKISF